MRNILILITFCAAVLVWLDDIIFFDQQMEQRHNENSITLSDSQVSVKQFNVEDLAFILGVDFSRVGTKKVDQTPDEIDVTLSLISIHTSGGFAKARFKASNGGKDTIVDAEVGESFHSLELTAINSTNVELKNNDDIYLLKMYKPQTIRITTTKRIEDVSNDN